MRLVFWIVMPTFSSPEVVGAVSNCYHDNQVDEIGAH